MTTTTTTSWLDSAHQSDWAKDPFFAETVELLRSVRDHDFDSLAELCDDDFGIVDLDQSGGSVMIRTRAEWEAWFHRLFSELDAAAASTDSEILDYQAIATADMGFSVVEFRQSLGMGELIANFDCVATIVWKRTEQGWKEARWHVSLLSTDLPDGFQAA
ncbi:MAG: nuclear transport factor 2 family protein [Acidimicrobiia bacterium]|nr:nuclear transport factor 2 family protein [Acidimicrobiia bacterium]